MKIILILLVMVSSIFADYSISYTNLKLGTIEDINTVKENYFKAKVTNPMAKFLLGKKEFIFFNEKYNEEKENKKAKYKKDKYFIIDILKKAISNNLKEERIFVEKDKYIDVTKNKDYEFKYISKGKVKSFGKIVVRNFELISLVDEKNNIKILKQ